MLPPAPSGLRDIILDSLAGAGRTWRLVFEGMSLAGLEAALRAGLGVCAFAAGMEHFAVHERGDGAGLPELPKTTYMLLRGSSSAHEAVAGFQQVIRDVARDSFRVGPGADGLNLMLNRAVP